LKRAGFSQDGVNLLCPASPVAKMVPTSYTEQPGVGGAALGKAADDKSTEGIRQKSNGYSLRLPSTIMSQTLHSRASRSNQLRLPPEDICKN
jgi:hypothetical protein